MMNRLTALALRRAGFDTLSAFQRAMGLPETGLGDAATLSALEPWLLGYRVHTIQKGDTFWALAKAAGVSTRDIAIANPALSPENLPLGAKVRIPMPFPVVPEDVPMTSALCSLCIRGIAGRYPFAIPRQLTTTATGRPLLSLTLGSGPRRVLYTAAHHGNEWLTATLLLKFAEQEARAIADGADRYRKTALTLVPMVNPDGADLVTGAIGPDSELYDYARVLGESYPGIPFPDGWKANLLGVDLNLNYPAGWQTAREIKFSQGYTTPGPRDFVGNAPFSQRETRALRDLTRELDPAMVLAFHSQGQVIYWQFKDIFVPGAEELGRRFAEVSGYTLADTPYNSSFAGFKDWFIQQYRRPGYTIEVGSGTNPLPLSQFTQIWQDNAGILRIGVEG